MAMPDETFQTERLVIIGPGMLGTSLALALKQAGYSGQTVALGRNPDTLAKANQTGAYDEVTDSPEQALSQATLAVVAVPLSGFKAVFSQLAEFGRDDLIITDVGSTKASVIADAKLSFNDLSRIIGAHPMAGSEKAGPSAGKADLFEGKPCILTLAGSEDTDAVDQVTAMWRTVGMKLVTMTPEEHDAQVAVVSHLPHLAAVMLVQSAEAMGGLGLASTGYRDTTRLASSNPPMRADILLANREYVNKALAELAERCKQWQAFLAESDREQILQQLSEVQNQRERWLSEQRNNR